MSQDNIEVVRQVYGAVNRRDWDAAFRDAHPDFELKLQRFDPGTHRGRERIAKLFEDFVAAFDTVTWEPDEFFERDDVVVALITVRARPSGASEDLVMHNGHLWTIATARSCRCRVSLIPPRPSRRPASLSSS